MDKMDKFKLVAEIEKTGYVFGNEMLPKLVGCFYEAGLKVSGMVPAAILTGLPGAGKTYLAECFASAIDAEVIFYQVTEDTNASVLVGDINPAEVVRGNAVGAISDGALIKACKAEKPIVLILDEWDKSASELDAFLLDFLQSRRIRDLNGEMKHLPSTEVWVFLTSNGDRSISDALSRRMRKWEIEKLPAEQVAKILGIETNNQLLTLWDGIPELALSQLEAYIQDMGGPEYVDGDIDTAVLGQYINIPKTLPSKQKQSGNTVTVTVSAGAEYWDIEEALMEHPVSSRYVNSDDLVISFEMENVVDWLRFASNLKDMVTMDEHMLRITAEMTGENSRGAYVPLEFLEKVCRRCETYGNHAAVILTNGTFWVGEIVSDWLVHFEQNNIADLFRGG